MYIDILQKPGPHQIETVDHMYRSQTDCDLGWPWLAMAWSRAWIPRQRLDWVKALKALDPSLDRVVSDKVPGPLVLQQRISTKTESSEASKVFIKREKMSVCIDSRSDSRRERITEWCPCGSLNYFYGAFLLSFLWPIILICLIRGPYLVYQRIHSSVHTHLLAKVEFT